MLKILALLASLHVGQATGSFSDGPIAFKDMPLRTTVSGADFTTLALTSPRTTDALKVKGFRYLKLTLIYTYGAATAVLMSCQQSEDGTIWSDIHVLQYAAYPVATSAVQVWSYAAGAAKTWDWSVPVRGVFARCTLSASGSPTASDTLTVLSRAGF